MHSDLASAAYHEPGSCRSTVTRYDRFLPMPQDGDGSEQSVLHYHEISRVE